MAIPTLYVALLPALLFSPIGLYLPVNDLVIRYYLVNFAAGTAFGCILITSFNKNQ
jgi:hypothetical protein